ncbi:MAG: hypothetical protein A2Z57_05305 [Planctomycetes bacterium RIFCSPHIGHO2_12_39_6]|nr:MAG: hypothetical protein A2Z57_05305 [Planctomycetes bacterium RIFCSPHIGHO2_12_39_6]
MIGRILSFIFLPIFIWMLIGSYKEVKRNYDVSDDKDFLFKIFWLFGIAWVVINLFTYAFFNISIVLQKKYW